MDAAPIQPGEADVDRPAEGVLSPEETRALLARARAGDREARDRLVRANLRLVASVAARFAGRGVEYEDLFQVGCVGLIKAIDRFNVSFDVRFSTYAVPVIMGEIRQFLRSEHPVRLGRSLHELAARVAGCRAELAQRLGRTPTAQEIAAELAVAKEDVVAALEASQPVHSLDAPLVAEGGDDLRLGDRVAAPSDGEALVENAALKAAMARLAEWERQLLAMRFLLDLPQTEVARRLGVSQAHVSRTEQRLLRSFREWLA
ncbi:MAG: SigB/SigF/SigG family RNA polymerase sigma factor [Bacillota bacterium]